MSEVNKTGPEEINRNPVFMLIETLPVFALYLSYACAMDSVPAEGHMESLVSKFFEAISAGDSQVSGEEILGSVLDEMDSEEKK
jgi:hypothetical protein